MSSWPSLFFASASLRCYARFASPAALQRQSATGFPFSRSGGTCPLWNVYEAFNAPGRVMTWMSPRGRTIGWPLAVVSVLCRGVTLTASACADSGVASASSTVAEERHFIGPFLYASAAFAHVRRALIRRRSRISISG